MTFRFILILLALCVFASTANARVTSACSDEQQPGQIANIGEFSDDIINNETRGVDDEPFASQSLSDIVTPDFTPKHSSRVKYSHKSFIHSGYNIRAPPALILL